MRLARIYNHHGELHIDPMVGFLPEDGPIYLIMDCSPNEFVDAGERELPNHSTLELESVSSR